MHPVHTFPLYFPKICSHPLHLSFLNDLFLSGFPTKTFYAFLISPKHAKHPVHGMLLNFIILMIFGEAYKLQSSSLWSLLHFPTASSLLCPNILLTTLFLNDLNPCSSLSVRDQVSYPYKTTGKIMVLYALTFKFLKIR